MYLISINNIWLKPFSMSLRRKVNNTIYYKYKKLSKKMSDEKFDIGDRVVNKSMDLVLFSNH